jgi:hypothetical protein
MRTYCRSQAHVRLVSWPDRPLSSTCELTVQLMSDIRIANEDDKVVRHCSSVAAHFMDDAVNDARPDHDYQAAPIAT